VIYLGFPVLDAKTHNMRESISEAFARIGTMVENPTGKRTFDDHSDLAFPSRSFTWTATTRAECVALRAFLDARQGRLNAFWVPTCCWDLPLAQDVSRLSSTRIVQKVGYLDGLAGVDARSYIAVFCRGQAMEIRRITGAAAIDDSTEAIAIDAVPPVDWPRDTTAISYLVLCRLANDLTPLRWHIRDVCEASIVFQEVPLEVPAGGA
jgi:hypothetical protein